MRRGPLSADWTSLTANSSNMNSSQQTGGGSTSRRAVLAVAGGLASIGGLAGCLGRNTDAVTVLSAGSLATTFEEHIGPAFEEETGISLHGEYYGSNALMRMIEDRTKHPDVIVSADATLLRDRLYDDVTEWDIEFASNSVGIGYNEETAFGKRLDGDDPWFEIALETEEGDLAIADPDLDPLGYRAVQAFDLAEKKHDVEGLRKDLLQLVYKEPEEPQIMAAVESGARAAAIVYRNMAIDHEMLFYEFPAEYNFANPELADYYATVQYTTDEEEYTAEGRPVLYNATVNDQADEPDSGHRLIQFLIDNPAILGDAGLTTGEYLPRPSGNVPEGIEI